MSLEELTNHIWLLLIYMPVWLLTMNSLGMYTNTTFNYFDRILRNVLASTLIAGILILAMELFVKSVYLNGFMSSMFIASSTILLLLERYVLIIVKRRSSKKNANNIIIIGIPKLIDKFEYYIEKTGIDMNIIGYVDIGAEITADGVKIASKREMLGKLDDLGAIIKSHVVDEVIFLLQKELLDSVEKYILICEEMGITARVVLELYDFKVAKTYFTSVGTMPMLTFHTVSLNRMQLFTKRIIDIIGSLIGLLFTAMISIFLIPAIKLDSQGPILFKQIRVGLNGRTFLLYKFRSMYMDAEEKKKQYADRNEVADNFMFKLKDDPRITRVGKFIRKTSIDEFPQFFNIFRGDMSMVGTRPPTLDEIALYENRHRRRISIKPGLTGMWQVSGRSAVTDFNEVVNLDTRYIDQWSILLDLKIILKTIAVVFKSKGAY